jgi:uncharacterized repeat protein (TIGR03837 family)
MDKRMDNGRMTIASLHAPRTDSDATLLWDVFCRVIDNFGDLGVCWRLCADLAARGHRVRLWVDDATALQWMAPSALDGTWPRIQVLGWGQSQDADHLAYLPPADVWIEGFGCEITPEFIASYVYSTGARGHFSVKPPVWINLEYLSAEPFVERCHGLPSPVMSGPAKGWTKHFFYPGFTAHTGGLLRESGLVTRQQAFAEDGRRTAWLAQHGVDAKAGETLVSLFCYEPAALHALLAQLDAMPTPTRLLVTAGRASAAVRTATTATQDPPLSLQQLRITYLPTLTQGDFDHLLWACDLNFVRGEDSLVRALWAGKPLVWQIYPQEDAAHIPKLDAFLDMLDASPSQRSFHHDWNAEQTPTTAKRNLPAIDLQSWAQTVQQTRERLMQMDDLTTQLLQFTLKKR